MHRPRWIVFLAVVIPILALIGGRVSAAESRQGDQCVIAADETVATDLYVICNTLTVEGAVDGDLIGAAWSAVIAPGGRVTGDVWLVGGQFRIDGAVEDDIHFAGVDLDLTDRAALSDPLDVSALAINVEVWSGAALPGDLLVSGYQTVIRGDVAGRVNFNGTALVIAGDVQGDVYATLSGVDTPPSFIPFPFPFSVSFQPSGLTLGADGHIGGALTYSGPQEAVLQGPVGGPVVFDQTLPRPDITAEAVQPGDVIAGYLNAVLVDVLALLVAGVLALLVAPDWLRGPADLLPRRPLPGLGWGLLVALLAAPVALIVVLFSVAAALFLAVITLGGFTAMGAALAVLLDVGVISGLAFVIFFGARLVVSLWIGRALGRRLIRNTDPWVINLLTLLIGVILYALATNFPIPLIGTVLSVLGILAGLGALVLHARQLYEKAIRPVVPLAAAGAASQPASPQALDALRGKTPPPPPESSEPPGPGLDDLPPGFTWWE